MPQSLREQKIKKLSSALFAKKISFDELPCIGTDKNSIDWEAVTKVFRSVDKKCTDEKAENMGLVVTDLHKPAASRGGIILFGKNRLREFPDAIIRCVCFLGTTKGNAEVLDHAELDAYPILAFE